MTGAAKKNVASIWRALLISFRSEVTTSNLVQEYVRPLANFESCYCDSLLCCMGTLSGKSFDR